MTGELIAGYIDECGRICLRYMYRTRCDGFTVSFSSIVSFEFCR